MSTVSTVRATGNTLTRKPGFSFETFKQLWEEQRTLKEMAQRFGVAESTVCKTAQLLKLKSRAALAEEAAAEWTPEDPTIDEIIERAAEIRASWPEEERQRRISRAVSRVELKHFIYHPYTASFSTMEST